MNREPVNPDDPQMTAYALGELSVAEAAEFEARLQLSPLARRELAEMREVMTLLGEGLRGEWQSECQRPALTLLAPVPANPVVVPVDFRSRTRGAMVATAGIAAVLLAGATLFWGVQKPSAQSISGLAANGVEEASPAVLPSGSRHVPQLFLAEEVEDLASLNLVGEETFSESPVDTSYLEAGALIPAGYHPAQGVNRIENPLKAPTVDRVDSYLPPLDSWSKSRGTTTLIERRLGRGGNAGAPLSDRVLVSGYVTMGGGETAPRFAGGFRPVSISGNPVVNEESDLRLLADLNGLQKELSEVIGEMPQGSEERSSLERILQRSERVVSQLKEDLAP